MANCYVWKGQNIFIFIWHAVWLYITLFGMAASHLQWSSSTPNSMIYSSSIPVHRWKYVDKRQNLKSYQLVKKKVREARSCLKTAAGNASTLSTSTYLRYCEYYQTILTPCPTVDLVDGWYTCPGHLYPTVVLLLFLFLSSNKPIKEDCR